MGTKRKRFTLLTVADDIRLTLTAANKMEPQWNPMLEDQALDRVYRIGQSKEVTTIRYIVKGTSEEVSNLQRLSFQSAVLTLVKSIRHQQTKKWNLAEHALTLAKRQDNWIEVRMTVQVKRDFTADTLRQLLEVCLPKCLLERA